ncbi:serine/threonine protein kinase [Marinilactibacillus piezotolerans]|uniref:Serine/threonine protein kinase n=1 Tax=Marinilactibacillus piezotolerans TaxID=258723 RepID=A0A1I3YWL7_9LACT|nr:serine/threonine-protein kinase [Marinilactibacillus piezotolerans]SFK36238.1 serine/threonine protein kinase [Marinilactibacillus piezotolerans]
MVNDLVKQELDGVKFKLRAKEDFSFLSQFGKVFCVFDQNDSGNISFGVINNKLEKFFIKVAGAQTLEFAGNTNEAVEALKNTIEIYSDLKHPSLINMISSGDYNNLFYIVFRWAEGDCLYDHWNFDYYHNHPEVESPRKRFAKISNEDKLETAKQILEFMAFVESKGYVAVDFYDGSLMYDFKSNQLTICDIDLFKKSPVLNDIGSDYWGTKRMKAPEEYHLNAIIDSRTNVFTIGALFFNLFGNYSGELLRQIYTENKFIPLEEKNWALSSDLYNVALDAVKEEPEKRYATVKEFKDEWINKA